MVAIGDQRYKARAEAYGDIPEFLRSQFARNYLTNITFERGDLILGGYITFTSGRTLEQLRAGMQAVNEDSHVMRQTLLPLATFTGDRNWDID